MAKSPPWGLRWRSSTLFILSTVGIGLFTDIFLYSLVIPILPFILQDRIALPADQIQSAVSGLLAAYAAAQVLFAFPAGVITDRLSARRTPFLVGLVALLAGTLTLGLGQSVAVLAIARVLQGLSAAVVWTVGFVLVLDTVGPDNLGKTNGTIFAFISTGGLVAPVLGGVVYQKSGYGGIFGMSFAILAVDFVMRLLLIEKKVAAQWQPPSSSPSSTVDRDNDREHQGERATGPSEDASEDEPLLGRKEELGSFKIPEDRYHWAEGVPLLYCFQNPRLLIAQLLALIQATLFGAFDATVPTEAQELFGFNSLNAGLLFIALVLPYLLLGAVAGWAVDRYGTKPISVVGFGYLVPVLVLLHWVRPGGTTQIIIYCVFLALCGVGLGIIGSISIVESSQVVRLYEMANPGLFGANGPYAQLYGIGSVVFSLGLTIGPLISGGLKDRIGYGNMNIVAAASCAVTAVLCYVYVGGKPKVLKKN
ncbi:MAG: hypothetical protein LQ342_005369 [Letrouitia transgressa]|nr:MAG: hypothetical protein LQ342_005369 [Letrouitia transgressa]